MAQFCLWLRLRYENNYLIVALGPLVRGFFYIFFPVVYRRYGAGLSKARAKQSVWCFFVNLVSLCLKPVVMNNRRSEKKAALMDKTDKKILALLQEDAAQPIADIARKIGLSVTPCWRRIQRLEEDGVIRGRVALLDAPKIGLGMSVFVAIRTNQHNADWLADFARTVAARKEVVEFYRMSGEVDYLLRVVVPDMAAYDRFYKDLIAEVKLSDVSSSFAMEEIKYTTALPLAHDS